MKMFKPLFMGKLLTGLFIVAVAGCGKSDQPSITGVVPVTGVVTLDDKPLAGAQVLYVVQQGEPFQCAGVTDEKGMYQLQSAQSKEPGALPGNYKVVISCLTKPDGSTVVADANNSPMQLMVQGAKEVVPPRYSDLLASELKATVPPSGTTQDFPLTSK